MNFAKILPFLLTYTHAHTLRNLDGHEATATCSITRHEGYELTSPSAISPVMEGKQIVIVSKVTSSPLAACTAMLCPEEDACCNSCTGPLALKNSAISLTPAENVEFGCSGTNCDWEDECTYEKSDVVIIFGTVTGNGTNIVVEDSCLFGSSDSNDDNCGSPKAGYQEASYTNLPVGQSVMVTSTIGNSDLGKCTQKLCGEDNLCCNICSSSPAFGGNVSLTSDTTQIGCYGTNCDFMENCIYEDGELATVYGTAASAVNIAVDDHCKAPPTCKDMTNEQFGLCFMHMGYGVVNGTCAPIGGCGSKEYTFFTDEASCLDECIFDNDEDEDEEFTPVLTDKTCIDYTGKDFGLCKMVLGYGLVEGSCQVISGCNATEMENLFQSELECNIICASTDPSAAADIAVRSESDPDNSSVNYGSFSMVILMALSTLVSVAMI